MWSKLELQLNDYTTSQFSTEIFKATTWRCERKLSSSRELTNSRGPSAVAGLPTIRDSAETVPKTEWEEWWDLFYGRCQGELLKM